MSKQTYEFIAATSEEAIENGLETLGVTADEVIIDVVDTGAKGIFGLGSRQAKVSITFKADRTEAEDDSVEAAEVIMEEAEVSQTTAEAELEKSEENQTAASSSDDIVNDDALSVAVAVVEELVEKMRIRAKVTGRIGTLETSSDQPMVLIDIKGDDLSYLIGRHSETLNALQYITSLIVGRELGHWVPMMIDVQGYRERREKQLRQMALRLSEQVVKSGRRISLEPMPGTERRLIHLILRGHAEVYTESIGEEPNRKVVIFPKDA